MFLLASGQQFWPFSLLVKKTMSLRYTEYDDDDDLRKRCHSILGRQLGIGQVIWSGCVTFKPIQIGQISLLLMVDLAILQQKSTPPQQTYHHNMS